MTILLIMIPLSLLFLGVAVASFFWAVNHDQFEDMDSPGLIPLSDDAPQAPTTPPGAAEGEAGEAAAAASEDQAADPDESTAAR